MSESSKEDELLSSELPNDKEIEESLREAEREELYIELCNALANVGWKIVEKTDPETGFISHVLVDEDGLFLGRAYHANRGIAAMVFDGFVGGVIYAEEGMKGQIRETLKKLAWRRPPSDVIN